MPSFAPRYRPVDDPSLGSILNRGYGRGVGTLLLPSGQQLAVSQEEASLDLNNVLARAVMEAWMSYMDPPDPPEGGTQLRAKDLKNHTVVLRPRREATEPGQDGKPWHFVECEAWVIDRSGIEQYEPELRISWWRAVEQLRAAGMGSYVVAKVREGSDNSIYLDRVGAEQKQVIDANWSTIANQPARTVEEQYGTDEEPF